MLFRDRRLAVVDKPSGASLLADRSGADCLWDRLPELLGTRPYLVHRLDKGTSGVLLIALTPESQRELTRAFQARLVRKFYLAAVVGELAPGRTFDIDLPLTPGRKSRYRVAGQRSDIVRQAQGWTLTRPADGGHPSLTRLRALARDAGRSLVAASPITGRTHQLRVHLSWIGHPILGDHLYGRPGAPEQQAARLMLHCHRLIVPGYGTFTAPPPPDWLNGCAAP